MVQFSVMPYLVLRLSCLCRAEALLRGAVSLLWLHPGPVLHWLVLLAQLREVNWSVGRCLCVSIDCRLLYCSMSQTVTTGCSEAVLLKSWAFEKYIETGFGSVRIDGLFRKSCNQKQWDEKEKMSISNWSTVN